MRRFGRRRHDDRRFEDALRASLLTNARRAPSGDGLAERVLAAVDQPPPITPRPTRRWTGWALPAVAAASVAAVAAIAVGITTIGTTPAPTKHHPNPRSASLHDIETTQPTPPAGGSAAPSAARVANLHEVRVLDLTFAGTNDGWALASSHCLSGPGRCTALLRTRDGRHWQPMSGAASTCPACGAAHRLVWTTSGSPTTKWATPSVSRRSS